MPKSALIRHVLTIYIQTKIAHHPLIIKVQWFSPRMLSKIVRVIKLRVMAITQHTKVCSRFKNIRRRLISTATKTLLYLRSNKCPRIYNPHKTILWIRSQTELSAMKTTKIQSLNKLSNSRSAVMLKRECNTKPHKSTI